MLFSVLLVLVAGLSVFLLWQSIWKSFYWRRHGIRGPMGWPVCGSMLEFFMGRKHFGHIYQKIYNDYPDVPYVGLYRLFNDPAVLLRSQEMIKEVMVRNFQHFQDNVLWVDAERDPLMWCNPFIAKGEQWKERRAELVTIFTPTKVKMSFPHIKSVCTRLLDFMGNNWQRDRLEAKELFSKFTIDVIASAGYGLDAQSFTNANTDFVQFEKLFMPNPYSLLDTVALLFSPALGKLINYYYAPPSVQNWLRSIIGQILENRSSESLPQNKPVDFVQWLIDAKDRAIDPQTIVGHCSTFMLEGFETSSSLMAFACYEYARNRHIQQRLQQEIDKVLERYDNELCYDAINEMVYLEATLYETLRLYPAMMALLKHCTKSFELPGQTANAEPFRVPVGMVFVVPVAAIHKDPNLYPQPEEFRPERFMEVNGDRQQHASQRLGCKFLGFGGGPRMCPGMRFGLAQTKAGLVTLLSQYSVHLPDGVGDGGGGVTGDVKPLELATSTFLTAPKNGVWLKFTPRVK